MVLDSLDTLDPSSDFIVGQRVRYAIEAGHAAAAATRLDRCTATPWWCQALRGLAWHRAGDEARSAAAFDSALAAMPDKRRCDWLDVRPWLPPGTHLSASHHRDCAQREAASARVFWLAAPLLSWRPHATRDEFLSRRTLAAMLAGTATPHHMSWGSDLSEVTLRYGWPDRWAREAEPLITLSAPEIHVLGDEPSPSFSFIPDRRALETPLTARPDDWRLSDHGDAPMSYAPGWLRRMDTLPVQIARFRRAGGDSMAVVVVYDARGSRRAGDGRGGGRAAALLAVAPESTLVAKRAVAAPVGAIILESPARPALAAVEVVDTAHSWAARWRGAVAPLARSALVSDLLLGLAGPAGQEPALDRAAHDAMASFRVTVHDTIALYWEVYAHPTTSHPARVTLRLTSLPDGGLGGVARALGLAHREPPLSLAWDDPGTADSSVGRSLHVGIPDVRAGRYRIELLVEAGGARDTTAREIRVVKTREP